MIAVVVVLISAAAHASGASWLAAVGSMGGTANAAVISSAVSIAQSLDTQTGIECAGLRADLVSQGKYMGSYPCADVTIGGLRSIDPGYAYLRTATFNYYISAVLCVLSSILYAILLALRLSRRAEGRTKELISQHLLELQLEQQPVEQ